MSNYTFVELRQKSVSTKIRLYEILPFCEIFMMKQKLVPVLNPKH